MRLIALRGAAGSGKDTVAGFILKAVPGSKSIALADPLKEFAAVVFNFSREQLWGPSEKRNAIDKEIDHARISHNFAEHRLAWIDDVVPAYLLVSQAREYLTDWFSDLPRELSPRYVLQTLGTEWGREKVDKDIWLMYAVKRAKQLADAGVPLVLVTDCRFPNEVKFFHDRGYDIWNIVRSDAKPLTAGVPKHASEAVLDDQYDTLTVCNDGTLETLEGVTHRLLHERGLLPDGTPSR